MTRWGTASALAVAIAVAAVVTGASPVSATGSSSGRGAPRLTSGQQQHKAKLNTQIQSLRDQVEEASSEEADLLGRIDDVRARRAALDAKVAGLDHQIASVQGQLDSAQAKLDDLQSQFVQAQTKLAIADAQVLVARNDLRARAVAAYMGNPKASAADAVLRVHTFRQLAATVGYFSAVVQTQRAALDRYSALRDSVAGLRTSLDHTKDEALAERNVVLARQGDLQATRQQQDDVRRQVVADEAQQQSLLDEVSARKAEFEAQIAGLQAESDAIGGLLRGLQTGQAQAPSGHGVLASPIPGAPVTSGFGPRVHPIFHDVRMHTGVDFGADFGTPIHAATDGVVVAAGPQGGYGNATVVDHGSSLATLYGHQSDLFVVVGQRVTRGQTIGAVGCSGFCTGPHLHFEVRVSGAPVDPLPYL